MLIYPSVGMTSAHVFKELLGEEKPTQKMFTCPQFIEKEKLFVLLNAKLKEVPSKTTGGTICDLVAIPIEMEPGLWAAHKMADTKRLIDLLAADKEGLIYTYLIADETRPYGGTKGEDYESLVGTYHFYKKKKVTDKNGTGILVKDYSVIFTFYREKPKFLE